LHDYQTVLNGLLAVDFYLHATEWKVADFVFDHQTKIALLTKQGCPLGMIPERGVDRICGMNSFSRREMERSQSLKWTIKAAEHFHSKESGDTLL